MANEFSTALIVGDDPLSVLPGPVAKVLAKSKMVYIGPPGGVTDKKAAVSIHTTDMILQESESMSRMDQVKIEFKPWKGTKQSNTTSDVLKKLQELVQKKA